MSFRSASRGSFCRSCIRRATLSLTSMVLLSDSPWSEGHHRPHRDQRAPGRLAPGGGEDGDPTSRWPLGVHAGCSQFFLCDELCTLQSCICHLGARRGTVYLKERILCFLGLCRDLAQALYPHPTVCCRVLGHTVPGTCNNQPRCALGPRSG